MAAIVPSTLTPFQRLMRLLGQYRREIRYIFLYALVSGLINLSLPLGVQAILGLIAAGGAISASWAVLILFITVGALFSGLLRLTQQSIMENLQRRVFADVSTEFAVRIPRLNLEALRQEHLPEVANRFFDTLTIQKGLPKLLIDGIAAVLTVVISLLLLSFYHSTFVTFSLFLMLGLGILLWWMGPRGLETSLKESKYKYKLAFWLEELSRVATTFKLAGENPYPARRADDLTMDYLEARAKHWRILIAFFAGGVIFRVLVLGGFLVLGSLLVINDQISIGQFVASEILVLFVVDSIEKLILLFETAYDVMTATEKLGQVTDLPLEREDGIRVEEFCGAQPLSVELKDFSYQYEDSNRPVLNSISLKIAAGERLAITGFNGSGKSTLMQVISVLKHEFEGSLLFNGLPKENLHLRSLREHIGDLSSQEDIFKGTLRENITLGREKVSLQQVLHTVEAVGLSDFIRDTPKGIDAEMLPGGKNTPGHIVTKILVARAIVSEPKLLALEEPLHNLHFRDRVRIAHLLTDRSHAWTMVCVTEDPLLASLCDRVIVLHDGEMVFDGTFDEVQKTTHYDNIFRSSPEFSTQKTYA